MACTVRVPPGSRIGKTRRSGAAPVDDHRAPEVERTLVGEQGLEAPGLRQAVVVHQPDQVGPPLDGPAQAFVEASGTAGVVGQEPRVQALGLGLGGPEPLPGAVGRDVVDDQDLVEPVGLGERPRRGAGAGRAG